MNYKEIQTLREHPQHHPIPRMTKEEFDSLLLNIKQEGILQPIEISRDGTILNGLSHFRIAMKLGMEKVPIRIINPTDEFLYMLDTAIKRHHLNEGQKAALILLREDYVKKLKEAAKERQLHGKDLGPRVEQGRVTEQIDQEVKI